MVGATKKLPWMLPKEVSATRYDRCWNFASDVFFFLMNSLENPNRNVVVKQMENANLNNCHWYVGMMSMNFGLKDIDLK